MENFDVSVSLLDQRTQVLGQSLEWAEGAESFIQTLFLGHAPVVEVVLVDNPGAPVDGGFFVGEGGEFRVLLSVSDRVEFSDRSQRHINRSLARLLFSAELASRVRHFMTVEETRALLGTGAPSISHYVERRLAEVTVEKPISLLLPVSAEVEL